MQTDLRLHDLKTPGDLEQPQPDLCKGLAFPLRFFEHRAPESMQDSVSGCVQQEPELIGRRLLTRARVTA